MVKVDEKIRMKENDDPYESIDQKTSFTSL